MFSKFFIERPIFANVLAIVTMIIGGVSAVILPVEQYPQITPPDELKLSFPQGMEYSIPYDTTVFVHESINEVYKTLFEAGVLVLIVILVFLQDWRATLVPATTVPVTIIGAFAAMFVLGFSDNLLTLFGLILAIGIVVDDAIATVSERPGPQIITRYNLYPTSSISGEAAQGFSSGQALKLMERMAEEKFPSGVRYEWTGISFQEKRVGSQALYIFGLAVLLVYLVLAAQYESWITPAAVILVVPLALLGTVAAVAICGMDNNIYTQIGIVLIIALASKNAILIVEFARELRAKGVGIIDAALQASRLRFRPILMTSFAFILGIFPLVNAQGPGPRAVRRSGRRSSAG
jgi:multidrug efflux pump subunit AcrB